MTTSSLESAATRQLRPNKGARFALTAVDGFVALTAVGGGMALAIGAEDARFSANLLVGTPFRSYLIPGLILAVVVGGSAAIATVAGPFSPEAGARGSLVAGVVLMGWIVGEILILSATSAPSWIEVVYFSLGLVMAVLGLTLGLSVRRHDTPLTG
jgi:hypothetical protein